MSSRLIRVPSLSTRPPTNSLSSLRAAIVVQLPHPARPFFIPLFPFVGPGRTLFVCLISMRNNGDEWWRAFVARGSPEQRGWGGERKNREAVRHNSLPSVDLVDVSKFRRTTTLWRTPVLRSTEDFLLFPLSALLFSAPFPENNVSGGKDSGASSLITAESIISSRGWNRNREIGLLAREWIGNAIRNGEIRSAEKFLAVVPAREDYSRPFSRRNRVCARLESSGEKLN